MFTYRSEPFCAWNWEEKSLLLGHGKGLRTGQGNFSSGSKKMHRARTRGKGSSGTTTQNTRAGRSGVSKVEDV